MSANLLDFSFFSDGETSKCNSILTAGISLRIFKAIAMDFSTSDVILSIRDENLFESNLTFLI